MRLQPPTVEEYDENTALYLVSYVDDEGREGGTRWLSADEVPRALICA